MSTLAQRIKQVHPWVTKIPQGKHGSGQYQKKYWKVTSDYVRIRDFFEWNGLCISCTRRAMTWEEFQAGHCKSWGACRGYSKWDPDNIFLQCPYCNNSGDALTGKNFVEKIRVRYGQKRVEYIEKLSAHPIEKMDDVQIVTMMKKRLQEMAELPVQPDYYFKVKDLL